jgi:hypothetical protein
MPAPRRSLPNEDHFSMPSRKQKTAGGAVIPNQPASFVDAVAQTK